MEELDAYFKGNQHLTPNSRRAYKHAYVKIMGGLTKSVKNSTQKEIIEHIETLTTSPNTKNQYLNLAIQMRKFFGPEFGLLSSKREKNQDQIMRHKNKMKDEKMAQLPAMFEVKDFMNTMYKHELWRSFIINYLLVTFNVRNKDLDLIVVSSKRRAKDPNENYLVLRKNDIVYIRRNYKTAKSYGEKANIFKSRKMRRALQEYVERETRKPYAYPFHDPVMLLGKGNGVRIDNDSIHNFVRRHTFQNLGEGDYNKIAVSEIREFDDFKKLQQMSKNRGTSMDNLITEYDLKFKGD
mgnify:FL=1|tara:strand:+ start:501 stop:1385 length:885 start_codon:yes stop_codon:yes gene_type:complete